jgi:hypothetical protein
MNVQLDWIMSSHHHIHCKFTKLLPDCIIIVAKLWQSPRLGVPGGERGGGLRGPRRGGFSMPPPPPSTRKTAGAVWQACMQHPHQPFLQMSPLSTEGE